MRGLALLRNRGAPSGSAGKRPSAADRESAGAARRTRRPMSWLTPAEVFDVYLSGRHPGCGKPGGRILNHLGRAGDVSVMSGPGPGPNHGVSQRAGTARGTLTGDDRQHRQPPMLGRELLEARQVIESVRGSRAEEELDGGRLRTAR